VRTAFDPKRSCGGRVVRLVAGEYAALVSQLHALRERPNTSSAASSVQALAARGGNL